MEPLCKAAVPVNLHHYTGRMVGGDPIIETESVTPAWVECGYPATETHLYRCAHGHERTGETCPDHAPQPGQVGCRACYDEGHECEMRAVSNAN